MVATWWIVWGFFLRIASNSMSSLSFTLQNPMDQEVASLELFFKVHLKDSLITYTEKQLGTKGTKNNRSK